MADDDWPEPHEDDDWVGDEVEPERVDDAVLDAAEVLRRRFEAEPKRVYYSKQLEVLHEKDFFHWVTNRAVRSLQREGLLVPHPHPLPTGEVVLVNPRRHRYPVADRKRVGALVEEMSSYNVTRALGQQGEDLVLGGFARSGFSFVAQDTREFQGRVWTATAHDLDQIWLKDGIAYGVEVKNTWGYIPKTEFDIKIRLAEHIGVVPVFAVRKLPGEWIVELRRRGGFALIFGWHMYPLSLADLAKRVAAELDLPADAPRRLEDGTMQRMLNFHERVRGRSV